MHASFAHKEKGNWSLPNYIRNEKNVFASNAICFLWYILILNFHKYLIIVQKFRTSMSVSKVSGLPSSWKLIIIWDEQCFFIRFSYKLSSEWWRVY